jgi:5,10-methenyltetrahydrofolate synthetase
LTVAPADPPVATRQTLRARLRAERERFATLPGIDAAQIALAGHLGRVLAQLEPQSLGLYWPVRSEFNAAQALAADPKVDKFPWALPYAQRMPREMHYRLWDRKPPTLLDECHIPACDGAITVPEIVLAPCVGFTREGFRLGYGGGYFDRWLAAHPHVTAIGVAWSVAEIDAAAFAAEPHDRPLALVVTERGVA